MQRTAATLLLYGFIAACVVSAIVGPAIVTAVDRVHAALSGEAGR